MYRVFLIRRSADLEKPQRWFYFLRFLRICLGIPGREMPLKCDTVQNLNLILNEFKISLDCVLREMRLLIQSVHSGASLEGIFSRFPQLTQTDPFDNIEIPSYFIEVLRTATAPSIPDIVRYIDENRAEILHKCFVDHAVIDFLVHDRSLVTQPERFLAMFFSLGYPLFEAAAPLFPILIARALPLLGTLEQMVSEFSENCWSLPSCLSVLSLFYRARLKGKELAEQKEFEVIQRVFLSFPSVDNSGQFAAALRTAEPVSNISLLLQKYLLSTETRFIPLFLVIVTYLRGLDDTETQTIVELLERGSICLPKMSRQRAIAKLAAHAIDEAFLLALAETNEATILDAISSRFR
jgi:hypothetical protein